MTTGIWILGDQLTHKNTALQDSIAHKSSTEILLVESLEHIRARKYHIQKLIFIWSSMRHFATELKQDDWTVSYVFSDSFSDALNNWIEAKNITELKMMMPSDRPFLKLINKLNLSCEMKFYPNVNFLWSNAEFKDWANKRKRLILEDFYREGRKKWNILLTDEGKPEGGKWNLDKQNRQPPKKNLSVPQALFFSPDELTQKVIQKVTELNLNTYGKIEHFSWAVTRKDALQVLEDFVTSRINNFGTYQDAMVTGEKYMWHSLISPYQLHQPSCPAPVWNLSRCDGNRRKIYVA